MGAAVEAWVLWWLGALQFLAAWWWWRGPNLSGTRVWVTGGFVLNGMATIVGGIQELTTPMTLQIVGGPTDRAADALLWGFTLVALLTALRRPTRWAGLALVPLVLLASSQAALWPLLSPGVPGAEMHQFIHELGLQLASITCALALLAWLRVGDPRATGPWIVVLGVLAFHYAELASQYIANTAHNVADGNPWIVANGVLDIVTFTLLAIATGAYAWPRRGKRMDRERQLALGFMAAGFVVGVARWQSVLVTGTLAFFALGLLRPLGFIWTQSMLERGKRAPLRWRRVSIAGLLLVSSALAVWVADSAWGLGPRGAVAMGAATVVAGLPLASVALHAWDRRAGATRPEPARPVPIEEGRVPLPPDWRETIEENAAAFHALPAPVRDGLRRMPRWQRLIIALDALPDGAPPNAYERSTPWLHLVTHCPYSQIGPEITRSNRRASAVMNGLGIDDGSKVSVPLVSATWGTALGLRSGRVRLYALTPRGRAVAGRLRSVYGLEHLKPAEAGRVIGEHLDGATSESEVGETS